MARERLGQIYHFLCKVAGQELASGLTDAQLVERFVNERDEAAFEVLLWRHGTMVLNVCRRILHHESDAEDAFQATFLTFVRKARTISRRQAVAGWLYRVAFRVALAAKARSIKVQGRQMADLENLAEATPEPGWDDLGPVLDEEMHRLPARYRLPVVLCYLEGKTNEEAARELGCPAGTIFSRLARGREMLRARLVRRGIALSAGSLATLLVAHAASASVTTTLVQATLKTALLFLAGRAVTGVSTKAITLAEGVLKTMFLTKLKATVGVVMALGLLIAGAGALGFFGLNAAEPDDPPTQTPPNTAKNPPPPKHDGAALVTVVKPRPGGLERVSVQLATVEPFEQVEIYSQVAGLLKNQTVDIGSQVKRGQLLAEIDAPILVNEEEQAAGNLASAKDQIEISKALLSEAEANLEAARALLNQRQAEVQSTLASFTSRNAALLRAERLAKNSAIDLNTLDESKQQANAAQAAVDSAKSAVQVARSDIQAKMARIQKAKGELLSRETAVRTAQAALERTRIRLSFTRLTAPFDGVITKRSFNNGDFIRAPEQGNPRPLLVVTRFDRMRVVAFISEEDVPFADPGDPVDLTISAAPGKTFTGYKIARVGSALDKAASMRVEIDVPNIDNLLRPGMNARATIHLAKPSKEGMSLPLSCVVGGEGFGGVGGLNLGGSVMLYPGPSSVYVIRNGKAHRTEVKTGYRQGNRVEILSGLAPGDRVVESPRDAKLQGSVVPVQVRK